MCSLTHEKVAHALSLHRFRVCSDLQATPCCQWRRGHVGMGALWHARRGALDPPAGLGHPERVLALTPFLATSDCRPLPWWRHRCALVYDVSLPFLLAIHPSSHRGTCSRAASPSHDSCTCTVSYMSLGYRPRSHVQLNTAQCLYF